MGFFFRGNGIRKKAQANESLGFLYHCNHIKL